MNAVSDVLKKYIEADRLADFLADLEYAGSANMLFVEIVRRMRRACGLAEPQHGPNDPKPLLDLMEERTDV